MYRSLHTTLVIQIICLHSPSMLVVHWSVSLSHVTWGVSSALYMRSSSHVTSPILDTSSSFHDAMLALATLGASDFLHVNALRSEQEEKYYQYDHVRVHSVFQVPPLPPPILHCACVCMCVCVCVCVRARVRVSVCLSGRVCSVSVCLCVIARLFVHA